MRKSPLIEGNLFVDIRYLLSGLKILFDASSNSVEKLKTVFEIVHLFSHTKIFISCEVLNKLSDYNSVDNSRIYKNAMKCVIVLISGNEMQIWSSVVIYLWKDGLIQRKNLR
ncbi:uncharacterized protein V1478_018918 [Vespula squamosa]|uniref:Uncharacterized protein n=1 Tax=Vespula squamosa TaxID=30214 RepID=A0ABD1ZUM6_VESSQ